LPPSPGPPTALAKANATPPAAPPLPRGGPLWLLQRSCLTGAARWLQSPRAPANLPVASRGSAAPAAALRAQEEPALQYTQEEPRPQSEQEEPELHSAQEEQRCQREEGQPEEPWCGRVQEMGEEEGPPSPWGGEEFKGGSVTVGAAAAAGEEQGAPAPAAAAPPPAAGESIREELTLLHAIQASDAEVGQREREVRIQVPEGVREDLKVRVLLQNMAEELLVPEGAQVGEIVVCELPKVAPMGPLQQRHLVHEDILMTRLRWVQLEDGTAYVTDEDRKQKKLEAYRTLRGRRMGLVLRPLPEDAMLQDL